MVISNKFYKLGILIFAILFQLIAISVNAEDKETRDENLSLQNETLIKRDIIFKNKVTSKKKSNYSCVDKEDDGHYEHIDCKKYWHCLYVGTIFEYALERKCPVGTMFHPIQRICEISTVFTCLNWRKLIYGKNYIDPPAFANAINEIDDSGGGDDSYEMNLKTFLIKKTTTPEPRDENKTTMTTTTTSTTISVATTSTTIEPTTPAITTTELASSTTTFVQQETTTVVAELKLKNYKTSRFMQEAGENQMDKLTTLFSSNLLEKLKNLNSNEDGNKSEQSSSPAAAAAKTKGDVKQLLTKNFTILTSKGKKTISIPVQKSLLDLNETIANNIGVLAALNSNNNINNNQIEIIKSIFSLKNRTLLATAAAKKKYHHTSKSVSTEEAVTHMTTSQQIANNDDDYVATTTIELPTRPPTKASKMQQQEPKLNAEYVLNKNRTQQVVSVAATEAKEKQQQLYNSIDDYGDESIETDDLAALDSDLLLNLQLNTHNDQYKLTNFNKKKKNSKLAAKSEGEVEFASDNEYLDTSNNNNNVQNENNQNRLIDEENSDSSESSAQSSSETVDQTLPSSSSFKIKASFNLTVFLKFIWTFLALKLFFL